MLTPMRAATRRGSGGASPYPRLALPFQQTINSSAIVAAKIFGD